jgi:hypothetical protein
MSPVTLQITSCLFGTVVLHAFYLRLVVYHHLFLMLTITSILFHATHGDRIRLLDKVVAHLCFLHVAFTTPTVLARGLYWLLLFPLGVMGLWFGQPLVHTLEERNRMHGALHALSLVGLHAYLWALYDLPPYVATASSSTTAVTPGAPPPTMEAWWARCSPLDFAVY